MVAAKMVRPGKRLGIIDQIVLSFFWFSLNFHWGAMLTVVVPTAIIGLVPDALKVRTLGVISGLGALVAVFALPIAGAFSDISTHPWGRRRPYVLWGAILNAVALVGMAYSRHVVLFAFAYLAVQAVNNVAGGPYQGLIPDIVPEDQRGAASGWMGLMTMLGTIVSVLLANFLIGSGHLVTFYWVTVAVMLAGAAVTVLFVGEEPLRESRPLDWGSFARSFIDPFRNADFRWVFFTRGMVMLGFYTILSFLEYYFKDVLGMADYVGATTVVSGLVMVGAVLSTLAGGWLSDRTGRKLIVFISGILMSVTPAVMIVSRSYGLILAFAAVFGLGYGAYTSVDWALAIDVLPAFEAAGKDLGVWGAAVTIPQVIAPAMGALVITLFQHWSLTAGYQAAMATAVLYSLLGSFLVWRIKGAR